MSFIELHNSGQDPAVVEQYGIWIEQQILNDARPHQIHAYTTMFDEVVRGFVTVHYDTMLETWYFILTAWGVEENEEIKLILRGQL
jgi:hypothetical protein|tara:strand:+ start:19571 stop:19828 length:258 start_codon:yes stop_codon:yes gene_type:complete